MQVNGKLIVYILLGVLGIAIAIHLFGQPRPAGSSPLHTAIRGRSRGGNTGSGPGGNDSMLEPPGVYSYDPPFLASDRVPHEPLVGLD